MILYNCILIISLIACAACFYYHSKEKKLLRHFIQHSRRHSYHKDIDALIQQRSKRYLNVCVLLLFIIGPLLVQNFVEGFIENNWKWIIGFLLIPLAIVAYKQVMEMRKNGSRFGFSFNRNTAEQS